MQKCKEIHFNYPIRKIKDLDFGFTYNNCSEKQKGQLYGQLYHRAITLL